MKKFFIVIFLLIIFFSNNSTTFAKTPTKFKYKSSSQNQNVKITVPLNKTKSYNYFNRIESSDSEYIIEQKTTVSVDLNNRLVSITSFVNRFDNNTNRIIDTYSGMKTMELDKKWTSSKTYYNCTFDENKKIKSDVPINAISRLGENTNNDRLVISQMALDSFKYNKPSKVCNIEP